MPSAVPRRSRNHPAAIFMPGGYTHASAAPVRNRRAKMAAADGAAMIARLAHAPSTQPAPKSRRALIASARLVTAVTSVPATNPACTAIVSHATIAVSSLYSAAIAGAPAVAENQSDIPSTSATATTSSIRRGNALGLIANDDLAAPATGPA